MLQNIIGTYFGRVTPLNIPRQGGLLSSDVCSIFRAPAMPGHTRWTRTLSERPKHHNLQKNNLSVKHNLSQFPPDFHGQPREQNIGEFRQRSAVGHEDWLKESHVSKVPATMCNE